MDTKDDQDEHQDEQTKEKVIVDPRGADMLVLSEKVRQASANAVDESNVIIEKKVRPKLL
jgi:uncharacterized protein (DUF1330 family)